MIPDLCRWTSQPNIFFTKQETASTRSVALLEELRCQLAMAKDHDCRCLLYNGEAEIPRQQSVAIFDFSFSGCYRPALGISSDVHRPVPQYVPEWARGTLWLVYVGERCRTAAMTKTANQLVKIFRSPLFNERLRAGWLPWGQPKSRPTGRSAHRYCSQSVW